MPTDPPPRRKWNITRWLIVIVIAIVTVVTYNWVKEVRRWDELARLLPREPLGTELVWIKNGVVVSHGTPSGHQLGHLTLPNGDIWRFAFLSHHLNGTSDSFSIFAGPSGTYRVRGGYFCCEVQLFDPLPKDSAEFVELLKRAHPSVIQQ